MVVTMKMNNIHDLHKMDLPHQVVIGNRIYGEISNLLEDLNIQIDDVVIITGPNIKDKILTRIDDALRDRPIHIVYKASWNEVSRIEKEIEKLDVKYLVAIGGGKTIDIAKLVAYNMKKEFISLPTAPSHDGIASPFASIKGGNRAYSYKVKPPYAVIVDMDIIYNAPHRLIASGVGDAIAKFTAVADWRLAKEELDEYYGDYAANLALLGAKLVSQHSRGIGERDMESIRTLVEALISDGVASGIAGSSRPCSGSEHLFSHAMDLYASRHALHGEQVGVGTILMSYLHDLDWKEIRDILHESGAPTNFKELGVTPEDIVKAMVLARDVRPERYTILHKINLSSSYAREVAEKTRVIW